MNNHAPMSDVEIRKEVIHSERWLDRPLITPYIETKYILGGPSYGPSSHGYDIRLGPSFIKYKASDRPFIPGEQIKPEDYDIIAASSDVIIQPGGFLLGCSVETIALPPTITAEVKDKSTYVRYGITVQNTVLEAGWYGQVTLELINHGPRPVALMIGLGIAQVLFFRSSNCAVPYDGKYQNQLGVTLPR